MCGKQLSLDLGSTQCGVCKSHEGVVDICPYEEDIYGRETLCDCCEDCRIACAADI